MIAALIVFAVFAGMTLLIGVLSGAILLANGKLTLPGTNMRRVQHARVELELAKYELEMESLKMRMDEALKLRHELMASPAHHPGSEVSPFGGST